MRKAIWCILILTFVGCGWWLYHLQNDLMFSEATQKPDNALTNEENIKPVGRTTPAREYRHRDYGDIKFFNQDTRTNQANSNASSSSISSNVQKKLSTVLQTLVGSINLETDDDEEYTTILLRIKMAPIKYEHRGRFKQPPLRATMLLHPITCQLRPHLICKTGQVARLPRQTAPPNLNALMITPHLRGSFAVMPIVSRSAGLPRRSDGKDSTLA